MLKVECEKCQSPYQVDEKRVPATGLKLRCRKCQHSFLVKVDAAKPEPAAAPAASIDLDLPAVAPGGAGLPAPVVRKPAVLPRPGNAPPSAPKVAPAAAAAKGGIDLPAKVDAPDLPSKRPAMPAIRKVAKSTPDIDLPAPAAKGELPAVKPKAAPTPPKVVPKPNPNPEKAPDLGFGELDLPLPAIDVGLPVVSGVGLPAPSHATALPSPKAMDVQSPANVPPIRAPQSSIPDILEPGLPAVANMLPELSPGNLPVVANLLPQVMPNATHLPSPTSDERSLPASKGFGELDLELPLQAPPQSSPHASPLSFELEAPAPAPAQNAVFGDMFGELELPADTSGPAGGDGGIHLGEFGAPPPASNPPNSNPTGFGEVDLGGSAMDMAPLGLEEDLPGPRSGNGGVPSMGGPVEVALPSKPPPAAPPPPTAPKAKILPRVAAAGVVLALLGGAALQLTPYGAYGHVVLWDLIKSGDYAKAARTAADALKNDLADDTYAGARATADKLAAAQAGAPRAQELALVAAYAEFASQVRFGADAGRAQRAQSWLRDIKPRSSDLQPLVSGAKAALDGDLAGARTLLSGAPARVSAEAKFVLGEIELKARNWQAAEAAFKGAEPGARASFGLARAYVGMGKEAEARKALDAVLVASKNHPGAHVLRAMLDLENSANAEAERLVTVVLDGSAKATASPSERSRALAVRGVIVSQGMRPGDAIAMFDDALKLDGQNVLALMGQGELFYVDARYSESLSRFETALRIDATNVTATIGICKNKMRLDRVKEAKTQLVALQKESPKSMLAALWLAKVENASGEGTAAEKAFEQAIALSDPKRVDAVEPYVEFAAFLAAQGRTEDAEAKLAAARKALPPSPLLDRAFGDVAVRRGRFEEAVTSYRAALEKKSDDVHARFRLGIAFRKMGKFDMALAELDQVKAKDAGFPGLALERGMLFEQSGNEDKALEEYNGALAKAPEDLDLKLRVAAAYVSLGKQEEAIPMLEGILKQRSTSAEAHHYLGRAYLAQGGVQVTQALRFLKRAVELEPNVAEYHVYVAWAANEASPAQLSVAMESAEAAIKLDRNAGDGYWQRGATEQKQGALEDAVKDLKHALELKPTRFEAHAALAATYEDKNLEALAMDEWSKAIAANEKQPLWRYRFGKLLGSRKQDAGAINHLSYAVQEGLKASVRPGWLATASFELAEAFRRSGRSKEALAHYQEYLQFAPPNAPDRAVATTQVQALSPRER